MSPVARILCATDLSPAADEAIRQADARARRYDAELAFVHVLAPTFPGVAMFPYLVQQEMVDRERLAAHVIAAIGERVRTLTDRPADELTIYVEEGPAAGAIVQRAETIGADELSVASVGATGLSRLLLGDVAERVVRYAHCSVLVARQSPSTDNILVATDFSERSALAVSAAAEEARRRKAKLTVLHSPELLTPGLGLGEPAMIPTTPAPRLEDVRPLARRRLQETLEAAGVPGEVIVANEPPGIAILRAAELLPANLIMVGTSGRTGLRRMLLGSVAESVVRHAPCSVLVVRA